jgi:hypothetical protein
MTYSSRFFLYAPLTLFLALAGAAMAYWWSVATAIDSKVKATKGHEAVPGVILNWSKVTISGFPFRLDLMFDDFSAQGNGTQGPFAWKSEHFAIHALTYGAQKDVFEAAGRQLLSWKDTTGAHAISFLAGSMHASAVRDGRGLARFDLDIIDAVATDFTAGRLQFHMRRDPDGKTIDMMTSADEIKAADGLRFFGQHLHVLQIYVGLSQSAALAPLLRGQMSPQAADAAWHQARGAFTISKLAVKSSNLTATAPSADTTAKFAMLFSPLY